MHFVVDVPQRVAHYRHAMNAKRLKNKTAFKAEMLEMTPELYTLRRNVINILYAAKRVVPSLPRIEVRIVKTHGDNMGYAYLGKNIIHIGATWASKPGATLLELVLHEVVHAVTGFRHDETCPLMRSAYSRPIGEKVAWECFRKYFKA